MILSFAWTTPAVVLGEKTETRRDWSDRTIAMWLRRMGTAHLPESVIVHAYDRSPRFGGKKFGTVEVHGLMTGEDSRTIPDASWEAEGFHVLTALGATIGKSTCGDVWRFWREENDQPQTVVEFRLCDLNGYGQALREEAAGRLQLCGGPVPLGRQG